jgi:hypothetical protein
VRESICRDCPSGKQTKAKQSKATPRSNNSGNTFKRTRAPYNPSSQDYRISLSKPNKSRKPTHPNPDLQQACLAQSDESANSSSPHSKPQQVDSESNRSRSTSISSRKQSTRHSNQVACFPAPLQSCMQPARL